LLTEESCQMATQHTKCNLHGINPGSLVNAAPLAVMWMTLLIPNLLVGAA
jgi:hypothetical protein